MTIQRVGRAPRKPRTARGQALLAAIQARGMGLEEASKRAGISYPTLSKLIHDDPERATIGVVEAVCSRLGIPLDVVVPKLAKLVAGAAPIAG